MVPEVRFLDHYVGEQIRSGDLVVSLKEDTVDFVFLAPFDFVDQPNLIGLARELDLYCHTVISLLLEVVDQILLAFVYQVAVDGSFGVDRDQFPQLPPGEKRKPRKLRARGANRDDGAEFHLERDIHAVLFGVKLGRILLHAAGQAIFLG